MQHDQFSKETTLNKKILELIMWVWIAFFIPLNLPEREKEKVREVEEERYQKGVNIERQRKVAEKRKKKVWIKHVGESSHSLFD